MPAPPCASRRSGTSRPSHLAVLPLLSLLASAACGSTSTSTTVGPSPVRCAATATATPAGFPAAGGNGTLSVTSARECTWSVASQVPWISLVPPVEGQGDGRVRYTVDANPAASVRRGALVVGSQSAEITQEPAPCRFELERESFELGAGEGSAQVGVRAPGGCAWRARSGASWITVLEGAQGSGAGRVRFRVAANSAIDAREGSLDVAGVRVRVRQLSTLTACRFELDPPEADAGPEGSEGTFMVATEPSCPWTAVSGDAWLTVLDGEERTGPGEVRYRAAVNASTSPRTGSIAAAGTRFTVRQGACTFSLDPTSASFTALGGSGGVDVQTQSPCPWSASTTDAWIVMTSGSRTGRGRVSYTVAPNTRTTSRTGSIAVGSARVTITQDAAISLSGRVRSLEGSCPNRRFTVNGQRIRTTSSTDYEGGSCGNLAEGVAVRLKGLPGTDGVLTAFEVDF